MELTTNTKPFYHFPSSQMYEMSQFYNKQHDIGNKDDTDDDDNNNNDSFFQAYLKGYVKDSPLAPVLFVIDFDNTLAVFDEMYVLDNNSTNKLPSTYTRPFMYEFLDFIKSVNTNNVIVMWTAGTDLYIKQNLLLLNITQYFDNVLSRNHCRESEKKYDGKSKSHEYLVSLFPKYKRMRSILIDNLAFKNGSDSGYSEIISVKPFTLFDVAKTFGVFGISPSNIGNVELFFTSKGVKGTIKKEKSDKGKKYIWIGKKKRRNIWQCGKKNSNNRSSNSINNNSKYRGGDTTLLNLILYLQNKFFNIYDEKKIRFLNSSYQYNNKSIIKNNNNNNTPILLNIKNNYFSIAEINFV